MTRFCVAGLMLSLLVSSAALAVPVFNVTDLGIHNGTEAINYTDLNIHGHLCGSMKVGNDYLAFRDVGSGRQSLGTLTGGTDSDGAAINDNGVVTGYSEISIGTYYGYHAFTHDGTSMTDLGTLGVGPGDEPDAAGKDINNAGQVVGYSYTHTPEDLYRAFIYTDGGSGTPQMYDLGSLDNEGNGATAINESGIVVGKPGKKATQEHGFLWHDADGDGTGDMHDLGVLPGYDRTLAADINASGTVIGTASQNAVRSEVGIMWTDSDSDGLADAGGIIELGFLGSGTCSEATAINDNGWIVGNSWLTADVAGGKHATLYHEGILHDLNDLIPDFNSDWELLYSTTINNNGVILAVGWMNSDYHTCLLTPQGGGAVIPEPATLLLFSTGLAGLGIIRRRKK